MAHEPAAQEKIFALLLEWWPARALKQMLPNFKCCHLLTGDGKIMVYYGSKKKSIAKQNETNSRAHLQRS